MLTLNIPQKNDPIARIVLFALIALALYANVITLGPPANAQSASGAIILLATLQAGDLPTPALPTAAPGAAELALGQPTPAPAQIVYVEVPAPTPPPEIVYVEVPAAPQQLDTLSIEQSPAPT